MLKNNYFKFILGSFFLLALGGMFFLGSGVSEKDPAEDPVLDFSKALPMDVPNEDFFISKEKEMSGSVFNDPMERAAERVTKKPFGIHVSPESSPIHPERFHGYHTGADFEVFPEEIDKEIPISAICDGNLRSKSNVRGYGGVAVEECLLDGKVITVIYGHLKLESIEPRIGEWVKSGEEIGILSRAYSVEAGGERKHLHLAIHQGKSVNILGYVQKEEDLSVWIDPCIYLCKRTKFD